MGAHLGPPRCYVQRSFRQSNRRSPESQIQKTVPNERKLILYSLFKQEKDGDINIPKPGLFGGFEAKAKWDAWNNVKGKSKEDCWKEYCEELEKQKEEFEVEN